MTRFNGVAFGGRRPETGDRETGGEAEKGKKENKVEKCCPLIGRNTDREDRGITT